MTALSELLKISKTAWKALQEKPWDKRHGQILKQAYDMDPNSPLGKQWPAWNKQYGSKK